MTSISKHIGCILTAVSVLLTRLGVPQSWCQGSRWAALPVTKVTVTWLKLTLPLSHLKDSELFEQFGAARRLCTTWWSRDPGSFSPSLSALSCPHLHCQRGSARQSSRDKRAVRTSSQEQVAGVNILLARTHHMAIPGCRGGWEM